MVVMQAAMCTWIPRYGVWSEAEKYRPHTGIGKGSPRDQKKIAVLPGPSDLKKSDADQGAWE